MDIGFCISARQMAVIFAKHCTVSQKNCKSVFHVILMTFGKQYIANLVTFRSMCDFQLYVFTAMVVTRGKTAAMLQVLLMFLCSRVSLLIDYGRYYCMYVFGLTDRE